MGEGADIKTVQMRIEGRVQGVGFRYWVSREASRLGLDGWVRNRRDGAVEAVFSGPEAAVGAMQRLCGDGPPGARVTRVEVVRDGGKVAAGFHIEPTA